MTHVRGSNIRLAEEFVRARGGDEAWERLLERLQPDERDIVQSAIAVGWYELTLQHRVFEALDGELGRPGFDAISDFARRVADNDLNKVQRFFLRMRNPIVVLQKSGEYWNRFYDAGVWKVSTSAANSGRGELLEIPDRAPIFCRFLTAYIGTMFELAGARGLTTTHPQCACRGARSCVFEGTWSAE